jgi:hypothetical protein
MVPLITASDVGVVTSALLGSFAVLGLIVRYVLLPYLRDQVVRPLRETHRQVTPHDRPVDAEPTVVDRLDDLASGVEALRREAQEVAGKVRRNRDLALSAGRAVDDVRRNLRDHEAWAREEDSRLWSALRRHTHQEGSTP